MGVLSFIIFIYISQKSEEYALKCRTIQIGYSISTVLEIMGEPDTIREYNSLYLGEVIIYGYPRPLLGSSNVDIFFSKENNKVVAADCSGP